MKKRRICLIIPLLSLSAYQSRAQQITTQPNATTMATTISADTKTLNPEERKYAVRSLQETEAGVFDAVKGLFEAQLKYKPAADKWSAEDCVKHIAAAETELWAMVDASLKQPANPDQRAGIKFTDEQLVKAVEDRSHKSKTFAALEPVNSPYKTLTEALAAFKQNREKLIAFVQSTRQDLRNHVSVLPIGTYDAYQFILLISAHSNRHTQQIAELKADAGFPKN